MGLSRIEVGVVAAAALWAVGLPVLLLRAADAPPQPAAPPPVLAVGAPPPASALFQRKLFGAGGDASGTTAPPADAPEVVGIAGRIGRDAVALVRAADGRSRTLAPGDSIDGWRLESLAIDAAFFTRGPERLRAPLPAG
jgi:hypothetical protein